MVCDKRINILQLIYTDIFNNFGWIAFFLFFFYSAVSYKTSSILKGLSLQDMFIKYLFILTISIENVFFRKIIKCLCGQNTYHHTRIFLSFLRFLLDWAKCSGSFEITVKTLFQSNMISFAQFNSLVGYRFESLNANIFLILSSRHGTCSISKIWQKVLKFDVLYIDEIRLHIKTQFSQIFYIFNTWDILSIRIFKIYAFRSINYIKIT